MQNVIRLPRCPAYETWLPVVGFEGYYEVSDQGRVRSLDRVINDLNSDRRRLRRGHLKAQRSDRGGYQQTDLFRDGKTFTCKVHHLVLEAFVGPCPSGQECRHLDGNPANNRLDNLAWGTKQENDDDKRRHGTILAGERHNMAKLTAPQVREIRVLYATGQYSQRELSEKFGVSQSSISRIVRAQNWTAL